LRKRLDSHRVHRADLAWECDPSLLKFKTTAELKPGLKIIGQNKAMKALALGTQMDSPGYNLFICGMTGTGRLTAVRHILSRYRRGDYQPLDYCYVPNFGSPGSPRLLTFPAGKGETFRQDVHALLAKARRIYRKAVSSHSAGNSRPAGIRSSFRKELRALIRSSLLAIQKAHPGKKVTAYLRRLGGEILDREGNTSPDELGVNLISRGSGSRPPVVMPGTVSYGTLFGLIEHRRGGGKSSPAPHAQVRAGAILQAAGGVLVLPAADLLRAKGCWVALKNCLERGSLEIRDLNSSTGDLRSGHSPEPIPLDLKVILVGDYSTYDCLFEEDPEFANLFKIRVDFDSDVELARQLVTRDYPSFVARIVHDEGLLHFTRAAVAKIIEYGVRRAGRKTKITTQFSYVADLVREASYWARIMGNRLVRATHVQKALRESLDRLNLVETKMSEMIIDGTILIDTAGSRIGQVNGLAVYDQGDYVFGKPSRITAETSVGQGGIINIERESGFSGKSHDKGVQILGGYLRSRFAQKRPLSLTASVCFEQSYSGIDGDSASSTEIYAILSSLSGLPIRQDLAVTGSMNQKGEIQPIGGVNEKIEGFFSCVCAGRPTGREGVIIPRRNLPDLMLREDVVRAVRQGRFHIYAIRTVEEGIEILTGVRAGRQSKSGKFEPGSVFDRADRRLEEIAQGLRQGGE